MRSLICAFALVGLAAFAAPKIDEKVHNDRVLVSEILLHPGETTNEIGHLPSVTVYLDTGTLSLLPTYRGGGKQPIDLTVKPGQTTSSPALRPRMVKNAGANDLRYVLIEFPGPGAPEETWGKTGLAPNYQVLLENQYARVYDIRIPAHTNEPQHTHHDRVVMCLSGASLKHRFPDGSEEPSTLKTGEVAWRRASTHIGQNLGDTDLWVIAVEPK